MMVRGNPRCTDCKLHKNASDVCVMGSGPKDAEIMVIGRMENSHRYQSLLESQLEEVGLDPSRVYYTQAIKCANFEDDVSNADVKACRQYLDAEIAEIKPSHILTLGNEALLS